MCTRRSTYMSQAWPGHARIDANRIGIFGFSAGGFTALTAIGGEADLRLIASHCAATPEFACQLLSQVNSAPLHPEGVPPASAFIRDVRIKAAVVAALGLGFTFVPGGLAKVTAPVQLWSGEADVNVPEATNTAPVLKALGAGAEFHSVPRARHFSFLVPCRLPLPSLPVSRQRRIRSRGLPRRHEPTGRGVLPEARLKP